MDMEKRIEEAIIAQFFEPTTSFAPFMVSDPATGNMRMEQQVVQIPAPMTTIAAAIWEQAKPTIVAKVIEQMDIDAIVTEWSTVIAKDVVTRLNAAPEHNWSANPTKSAREKMLEKVYEQVADEFGKRCVEHLQSTGGLMRVLDASE